MSDIVERLRADTRSAAHCALSEDAADEIERLRERLGPRGLEVVMIDDVGHYVNEKVKAEIERLRAAAAPVQSPRDEKDLPFYPSNVAREWASAANSAMAEMTQYFHCALVAQPQAERGGGK